MKSWPLFFGLALMMVGNSLQGTLLGVRADIESFSVAAIGAIMTAYYIGFLAGSYYVPRLVAGVGHIRVFAALASLASTTILFHAVIIDPFIWGLTRIITGFAYAGLFIVVESWLNDASTNETRGQMLGLYLAVTYIGMAAGQMLLNIADPSDFELFVITSVLVSLALLPVALSRRPAPDFAVHGTVSFRGIWRSSPLGIAGMVVSGFATATVFSLGAVFMLGLGYDLTMVSIFMTAFIVGGISLQMPVSWLSDRMDRRKVIIALCLFSAIFSASLMVGLVGGSVFLVAAAALLGAVSLPIYGQCVSHVNDHLSSEQFVAASGTLLLLNGMGAAAGPFVISVFMQYAGTKGFVIGIAAAYTGLFLFGLYRAWRAAPVPLAHQGESILMPARGSSIKIYVDDL